MKCEHEMFFSDCLLEVPVSIEHNVAKTATFCAFTVNFTFCAFTVNKKKRCCTAKRAKGLEDDLEKLWYVHFIKLPSVTHTHTRTKKSAAKFNTRCSCQNKNNDELPHHLRRKQFQRSPSPAAPRPPHPLAPLLPHPPTPLQRTMMMKMTTEQTGSPGWPLGHGNSPTPCPRRRPRSWWLSQSR